MVCSKILNLGNHDSYACMGGCQNYGPLLGFAQSTYSRLPKVGIRIWGVLCWLSFFLWFGVENTLAQSNPFPLTPNTRDDMV